MTADSTPVTFRAESDEDAQRIAGVLEALGYNPTRELEGAARKEWAVKRLTSRYRLTQTEASILALVLDGLNNDEIATTQNISRATVKWRMHCVFSKTSTAKREDLLLLALEF